jgi:hypothetical protein
LLDAGRAAAWVCFGAAFVAGETCGASFAGAAFKSGSFGAAGFGASAPCLGDAAADDFCWLVAGLAAGFGGGSVAAIVAGGVAADFGGGAAFSTAAGLVAATG